LRLTWHLWTEFHKVFNNLLQQEKMQTMLKPILGSLAAVLLEVNGELDISLNQEGIAELLKLPIAQMANVNVSQLIEGMHSEGSFDQLELMKSELSKPDMVWFSQLEGAQDAETIEELFLKIKPQLESD